MGAAGLAPLLVALALLGLLRLTRRLLDGRRLAAWEAVLVGGRATVDAARAIVLRCRLVVLCAALNLEVRPSGLGWCAVVAVVKTGLNTAGWLECTRPNESSLNLWARDGPRGGGLLR